MLICHSEVPVNTILNKENKKLLALTSSTLRVSVAPAVEVITSRSTTQLITCYLQSGLINALVGFEVASSLLLRGAHWQLLLLLLLPRRPGCPREV